MKWLSEIFDWIFVDSPANFDLISLFEPVYDAAAGDVVRGYLHCYPVSRKDPDKILTHFTGNHRQYLVLVF